MTHSKEKKPSFISRIFRPVVVEMALHEIVGQVQKHIALVAITFLTGVWLSVSWIVFQIEKNAPGANITTYPEGLWWGIVTFLTVGYGDRYPVTTPGRIWAGILMAAGVIAVGILTAKISSYFLEKALREGRNLVDTEHLKDHFIICGWKDEMEEILNHILDFNPGLTAEKMVVIANLKPEVVEQMRMHPRLKKIQVVVGDYISEINLKRAAPERARKIIILADATPLATGLMPTTTEVDARTIMASMTLSHIAKGTTIAAEVMDPKMDHYLKLASVSEIIYSREYNRLLLGNVSGGTGVANIIFDLLDPRTPSLLTTVAIPDKCINNTYANLKTQFALRSGEVLVGILENSGNRQAIKEQALRRAQKTTDVNQLLSNLKTVKELKCNQPMFHPADSYVVQEGAMAIVIQNRKQNHAEQTEDVSKQAA